MALAVMVLPVPAENGSTPFEEMPELYETLTQYEVPAALARAIPFNLNGSPVHPDNFSNTF